MRIHPVTGAVAHGIAGDGVYVDGRPVRPGGGQNGMPDWFGTRLIYCGQSEVRTCLPDGTDDHTVTSLASFVRSSATGWAAWSPSRGVWTSWGLSLPKAVLFDMSADGWLLVGDDYQSGIGLSAYREGSPVAAWTVPTMPATFYPYPQAMLLSGGRAIWTVQSGTKRALRSYGLTGSNPVVPWNVLHPTACEVGGQVWVTYLRGEDDAVITHPWDYRGVGGIATAPGNKYGPVGVAEGPLVALYWSNGPGERAGDIREQLITTLDPIPSLVVPPVDTFGPVSPPLPDGTEISDLAPFLIGAPSLWPRTGTHPMHQVVDGDLIHFLKFDQATFPARDRYETWAITDEWVHHIEDASNDVPYSFTDTRWFPRRLKVGWAHTYDDGAEDAIFKARGTCTEVNRVGFHSRTWIEGAWDRFDCGPDLGIRRVVAVTFDPTDRVYAFDRGIEVNYFAEGAGWLRWEYHRSDVAMASGTPVFDDRSRVSRSDFYRFGGTPWLPTLTGCAPSPTVPPVVPPPPPPVETLVTVDQIATVLAGCLFERISAHLALNPAAPEADRRQSVHLWAIGTLNAIDEMYQGVFGRPLDLEGAGSRLLLYLDRPDFDDADMVAILEAAKARGER